MARLEGVAKIYKLRYDDLGVWVGVCDVGEVKNWEGIKFQARSEKRRHFGAKWRAGGYLHLRGRREGQRESSADEWCWLRAGEENEKI